MTDEASTNSLSDTSPFVQAHLRILQGVIERMAANSTSAKAWCITIVSAILVVVAVKNKPDYALLALIPTLLFCTLDAYYLAMEKGFRNAYDKFVRQVYDGSLEVENLCSVRPDGEVSKLQLEALGSFSVWGLYVSLAVMILLARSFVFR